MHAFDFPDKAGTFLFNSDFSGDVRIHLRDSRGKFECTTDQDREEIAAEFRVPGAALEAFLWRMIEYKLGDIGEAVAEVIIGKLKEDIELPLQNRYFCEKCGCPTAVKVHDMQGWDGSCSNCGAIAQSEVGERVKDG